MKLKSYHFSCGNSTKGTIGFCARVLAKSKKEALKILHEALAESVDIPLYDHEGRIEYAQVYISTENVRVKDIDEWEWSEEETNETPIQEFTEQVWDEEAA